MILRLALDLPRHLLFDYLPIGDQPVPEPGSRVLVQFGNAKRVGIVMATADSSAIPLMRLRTVAQVIDARPLLAPELVALLRHTAQQWALPIGKIAFAALPPPLRRQTERAATDESVQPREPVPTALEAAPGIQLAGARLQALKSMADSVDEFAVHLLSELYGNSMDDVAAAAIQACVRRGRTTLLLAPDIGHAGSWQRRLQGDLPGCSVALTHSSMTAAKRLAVWSEAAAGVHHVVVGTRSAALHPLADLGLVCITAENDPLYRAEQGLSYSARDAATYHARLAGCPVLMTAATPSLELRHAAQNQQIRLTMLPRPAEAPRPHVDIVDIAGRRMFGGISVEMENALRQQLGAGGASVVLNRLRGKGSTLYCPECRNILHCPKCGHQLSQTDDSSCLCHRCGHTQDKPRSCPACGGPGMEAIKPGTMRIAEILGNRIPEARIARVDQDSDLREIQAKVADKQIDIVVGTTALLALGIPAATFAIADADTMLLSGGYRSGELFFHNIVKLTAGNPAGRLLIQTRLTSHHLFSALQQGNYDDFAFAELKQRKAAGLPPYRRLALFKAQGGSAEALASFTGAVRFHAEELLPHNATLLEPTISSGVDEQSQLLVSAADRPSLTRMTEAWVGKIEKLTTPGSISWGIEVNPDHW